MTIYRKDNKAYRKIYIQHYGPIPIDEDGRTYEIHHIDGNHGNNDPKNLTAVSIQEHYDIHHSQGDWAACLRMSYRMKISPEEKSMLAVLNGKRSMTRLVESGLHPWVGDGTYQKENALRRIADGTHNLIGSNNPSHERVRNGTHNFLGKNNPNHGKWENGTHNFQKEGYVNPAKIKVQCPHCGKVGGQNGMVRWHFDHCSSRTL